MGLGFLGFCTYFLLYVLIVLTTRYTMSTNPDFVAEGFVSEDEPATTAAVVECLKQQGFTAGLAQSLLSATFATRHLKFPLRFWILDNSGSMSFNDGYRILETRHKHRVKIVPCTRWEELRECVAYHVELAGLLRTPTQFRVSFRLHENMTL